MISISYEMGQILTLFVIAVALGMDAFSLGIGIGLRGIRLLHILKVSLVVGLFHVIMPLAGMFMGSFVSSLLGDIAIFAGGALLVLLGSHMIYSALKGENEASFNDQTLWGLLIFAFSVSMDSFSVGISLGLFSTDVVMAVLLFGLFGGLMSVMGLWIGRRASMWLGVYGEALGGVILLMFGIKFIV